ncbi:hypothetical protein GCM10028777_39210 [Angustibacter speluncae]
MTDTLERELRRALADHAPDAPATGPDPWQLVHRGVVRRRRQRTGALAGSLALVVALGGGLAVVRPWAGDGGTDVVATDPASGWGLDDGVPRGSLAGDETLRSEVEAGLTAPPHSGPRPVAGSLRLVFADDVAGTRLVVASVRYEPEGDLSMVLAGPAGAPADQLVPVGQLDDRAGTAPAVVLPVTADDGPRLLAVVPRGAQVSVSDAVRVDAAGERLEREWRPVEVSSDGLVDTPLTAEQGSGVAVLRVDSAQGYQAEGPVAELTAEWPRLEAEEVRWAEAAQVVDRGPQSFRDGLVPQAVSPEDRMPVPDASDLLTADVAEAMRDVGSQSSGDARLLYASGDGADVDRGTSGWSSLVEVGAGQGSVVRWAWHPGGASGMVYSTVVPSPADASSQRLVLRVSVSSEQQLVGVWDPEGTLGTVVVDGEDLVMPEALGFRWFPVAAGSEVSVDGQDVPPVVHGEGERPWPLPGEETGPAPLFSGWS